MTTANGWTVRAMRSRWKPLKVALLDAVPDHPTHVRFHRACSWLQRVESIEPDQDHDLRLTYQWIAFNSLYGQWDSQARIPVGDLRSWQQFLDRMLKLDRDKVMEALLIEHKKLVLSILDDAYIAKFFWDAPSISRARQTTRDALVTLR